MNYPIPKISLPQEVQEQIHQINASAVELSRISRLPLACAHLVHLNIPRYRPQDNNINVPLFLSVADKQGFFYGINYQNPQTFADMMSDENSLIKIISEYAFQEDEAADSFFITGGAFGCKIVDIPTALRLPLVHAHPDDQKMIAKCIQEDWKGWVDLPSMPEGFEKIHKHVNTYSTGECWFYAEALKRANGFNDAQVVVLHLKNEHQSGYHACVSLQNGLYEDIWGEQSLEDIERRFHQKIVKEEPMMPFLNKMHNMSDKDILGFERKVSQALSVIVQNPAHKNLVTKSSSSILLPTKKF